MNEKIKEQIRMVNYAVDGIVSVYGALAKKCGLSYNGLMVLYVMEEYKKCTQKQISDILQLPKSTVHSILLEFIKNEYVILKTEEQNKKEKIIIYSCSMVLKSKAEKLYKKIEQLPNSSLARRCCNFKLLEFKSIEYETKRH